MSFLFIQQNTEKNIYSLNTLKLLLSFMVVFIHTRFFLDTSALLDTFTSNGFFRISVPIFFIINGYFLPSSIKSFKEWLMKSLTMYIALTVLYSFFWLDFTSVMSALKSTLHAFFVGFSHLWYLQAMIIAGVIIFLFKNKNLLLFLSVILFFLGVLFQIYNSYQHMVHMDIPLRYSLYRNAFTIGLPFMLIGNLIRLGRLNVPIRLIFPLAVISAATLCIEIYINYFEFVSNVDLNKPWSFDIYFSLILLCPAIFLIFLNFNNGVCINRDIPNYIYFFHPLPVLILSSSGILFNDRVEFSSVIIIITLMIVWGVIKIKDFRTKVRN